MEVFRRLRGDRGVLPMERLATALRRIEFHRKTLEAVRARLETRRQALFQAAIKAVERLDDIRATVYSSEHSEVKKVIRVVTVCELALAQVMLRLESIRDVDDVVGHMMSAIKTVKGAVRSVSKRVPSVEGIENEVNSTLSEMMAELGQVSPVISIDANVCDVEEIVASAKRYAEQKALELEEELPACVLSARGDSILEKSRRVALLATGSEHVDLEPAPSLLPTLGGRGLEQEVHAYISRQGGQLNILDTSAQLNIPVEDVEESVLRLAAKGRIKLTGRT